MGYYHIIAGTSVRYYSSSHFPIEINGKYSSLSIRGYLDYQKFFSIQSWEVAPVLGVGFRKVATKEIGYYFQPTALFFSSLPNADLQYLSSDYYDIHGGIQLSKKLKLKQIKETYIDINCNYIHIPSMPTGQNFNLRVAFALGVVI